MKTIVNRTRKPLRIRLPGDKILFLGVTQQAQLRDEALEYSSVKRLIEAGEIEVVEGLPKQSLRADGVATTGRGSAGHTSSRVSPKSGDR